MKRVLVTGASGMLGGAIVSEWADKYDIYATGNSELIGKHKAKYMVFDLLNETYEKLISWSDPEVIIHCAAITNGDYCEDHPEEAYKVNGESVEKLLKYAPIAKLIYISTDAVFPYETHLSIESDETGAQNVYGKSKELGEKFIKEAGNGHNIVRTTIVGKNTNPDRQSWVDGIVKSLKNKIEKPFFKDVFFTPISIWDLADELQWSIENETEQILHISGSEICTKYEFGLKLCEELNLDSSYVIPGSIDSAQFRAKRAHDQTLDCSFYQKRYDRELPDLENSIKRIAQFYN